MVGARTTSSPSSPPQPERACSSSCGFGSCMQGWHHRCIGLDPSLAAPSTTMMLRKVDARGGKVAPAGSGSGRARMLVTVTVLGSAGPLRFLIDEGETVASLIRAALRCYAREGRMPLLGADATGFLLYTANGGSDALSADEKIYFNGCRSFLLWQKAASDAVVKVGQPELASVATCNPCKKRGGGGGWKGGLNKFLLSFSFKL